MVTGPPLLELIGDVKIFLNELDDKIKERGLDIDEVERIFTREDTETFKRYLSDINSFIDDMLLVIE